MLSENQKAYDRHKKANLAHVAAYLQKNPCGVCGEQDIRKLRFLSPDEWPCAVSACLVYGTSWRLVNEMERCNVRCVQCLPKPTKRVPLWAKGR